MSKYEFSLQQEVLLEKGAAVLGDLFRYELVNGISMQKDPITVMHDLIWSAKEAVLRAKSETDLVQIEAQFDFANRFLMGLGANV